MSESAHTVEDPFFSQRYRFSRVGEVVRIEIWTAPGGGVRFEHFHPALEERYEVLEGEVTFSLDGDRQVAVDGDRLVVPPGARHSFENTGPTEARLVVEAEPAMTLQESIVEGAALGREGKLTRGGKPKGLGALLEAAGFSERHRATTVLTSPPPALQRLLFPPLAALQRRRSR